MQRSEVVKARFLRARDDEKIRQNNGAPSRAKTSFEERGIR